VPLARYFLCVGSVLLALLFIADVCLPKLPVVDREHALPPAIRIYSDRGWPQRVVYNTGNGPAITLPTQVIIAGPYIPDPERLVDAPDKAREAFAQARPSDVKSIRPAPSVKPPPKPVQPRRHVKRMMPPPPPPTMMFAQRQFGGYGMRMW
jgi:hypothetical protein